MEYVTVHGVDIPVLGFGTWEVTGDSAYRSAREALDVGYRHLDTAQAYENEEQVGRAIADSGLDRDDLFVTTKVWSSNASKADLAPSHDQSLERLGLDYVDLLLIHWPTDVPIEQTVEALEAVREDGKTRLIGVSNYPSRLLERAIAAGPVAVNQVEYHPFLGQDAVLGVLREHGLALAAYSPLAHGEVVGHDVLADIGEAHGKTATQVALRWLLQQPGVLALPRSENPEHIASNYDVFDFHLGDEEVKRIDDLPKDHRQIDPPFAPEWD